MSDMPRIRIHFSKKDFACFISHIDLPILFGRAARRAGLRAEQTQGFSPHPRLALCPPLPIGVVGLCEPADFWFLEWGDPDKNSLEAWNSFMPEGIEIISAVEVETGSVSLNKLCTAAAYTIEPMNGADTDEVASVLEANLREVGALLAISGCDGVVSLAASDLERCGPSRMVKSLIAAELISSWEDLAITRTAVGGWDDARGAVVRLMEDSGHEL